MNQNKIIGSVLIAVLAIAGIWYFSSSPKSAPPPEGMATTSVSSNAATNPAASSGTATPAKSALPGGSSTFKSIFTQSGSHQCSYEQVTPTGRSSSVIYLADGKMRGEFRTISGTDTSANLMIYSVGILYSWKEGATTGRKSSINSLAELPQAIPADLTSGGGFGTSLDNVSWDCHVWARDPGLLVLPPYVKF